MTATASPGRRFQTAMLCLIAIACSTGNSSSDAQETLASRSTYGSGATSTSFQQQIARLRKIEDRVLPMQLVAGPARNDSLADYYWDANIELHNRLELAVRAYSDRSPAMPYRAITLVSGPAGIGKTFVKSGVYNNEVANSDIWKFDVRELFEEMAGQGLAEMKPDIVYGDRVVSNMISLTPTGRKFFLDSLNKRDASFLVIDSLDEVHSRDSLFVLKALEELAVDKSRNFVHVVVFGRPLAFLDYWKHCRVAGLPPEVQRFCLHPPQFRTTGDLAVSTWNYGCWKFHLSRDGKTPMPFADFEQWRDAGFASNGSYSDVSFDANACLNRDYCGTLDHWSQNHRVVLGVIPNLAGNSILREMVEDYVRENRQFSERSFMDDYFATWLVRSTKSGNRPSAQQPEHLDLYTKMLEAVATRMVDESRVGSLGYFDVADQDRVEVQHDGMVVSVPIAKLLDHSGLVTLDPLMPLKKRYRFEPVWVHRLLLEMDAERGSDRIVSR